MTYKTFEEWMQVLPKEYFDFALRYKIENAPLDQAFFDPRLAFDACIERPRVDPIYWTLTNILLWVERQYAYNHPLPPLPTFDK